MAQPNYPALWQCLGMVVGVYGLLYAYAALRLDLARPLVAVGLLGKILGPIGWVVTVSAGEWPLRTFSLIVFNDLVWWLPFTLFLLEGTRPAFAQRVRAAAPYACAALNALAAVALLVALRPGTEVAPSAADRAAYIANNPLLWRGGWLLWMAAALGLLGFYAWWGAHLPRPGWALAGLGLALAGLLFDLAGDSLNIAWLPLQLETLQRLATLLSSGAGNGLYTLGGIVLTLATPWRGQTGLRVWAWAIWLSGLGLTASALGPSAFGMGASALGMMLFGGALLVLFCPWCVWMGSRTSWELE